MRLIDADSLLVSMDKGMQGTAREYLKFYQMAVDDDTTVYDVDKVVERLMCESINCHIMTDRAVEIVKSGGIE